MASIQYSQKAVHDLAEIWKYTVDEWSERQADRYYEALIQACEEIAQNPKLGKAYEEVSTDVRGYLIFKHIIFFKRISPSAILVVRILHSNMDLNNKRIT